MKNFLWAGLGLGLLLINDTEAFEREKTITCNEKRPQVVRILPGRITVLNFPFKPRDVVPGSPVFDFKQIKNDLVITALKSNAHTNAVIYLEERRCAFDLIVEPSVVGNLMSAQ